MKSLHIAVLGLALGVSLLVGGCGGSASNSAGSGGGGNNPPTVSSTSPTSILAGSQSLTLTVSGSGFLSTSVVQVGGIAEATTYVSSTQLTATVPAAQLASAAQLTVVVVNGSVNSGSGTPVNLEVDNPSPTISSVSPSSELLGAAAPVVTVTGTNFLSTTVINVNGSARPTTFVSTTQVSATLTAADVATAGTISLTAVNPSPGGGTSPAASLTVNNPSVGAIQLSPAALTVGAASATTVTVTGNAFVAGSVVQVNGSARATTYVSPTTLTFAATVADQATTGTLLVTVANPAPGGGTSPAVSLPVNNPSVGAIQLSPSALIVGTTSPTTITVTGNTFVPASVVQVNGSTRPTTYVNQNTLTFVATVADQATAGTLLVTVTNPAPGGGTSAAASLAVSGPTSTPVITSVAPNSIVAGSSDTVVSVNGTGFTSNSVVQWNGAPLVTSFYYYGTNQLVATVPAADLTTAGTASVTVSSPTANPSLSNALTVNITNPPAPTLTGVYPSGGPINTATAVTLNGTGFTSQLWDLNADHMHDSRFQRGIAGECEHHCHDSRTRWRDLRTANLYSVSRNRK